MNLYQVIFELIDMRSFSNLWYWIMLAVMWSSASHWVLGVPFDVISRARRHGGEAQDDLETLVRINTARMLDIARTAGIWLVGFLFFLISTLGDAGRLLRCRIRAGRAVPAGADDAFWRCCRCAAPV